METLRTPRLKDLGPRGFIRGVTISSKASKCPLCHFYGGVRYALPPPERWRRARPLPSTYSYGSMDSPFPCDGGAGVCPQPGFRGPPDESQWTEDCFQSNVWVPIGNPPKEGWPVFVFIHGGWLQFGTPNSFSVAALLHETEFKCIVVMPAYRLNVFGFLYSSELHEDATSASETTANYGFWDQRLALEWAKDNIHLFGGDAYNITLSGYSAGAYSVFHQLAYDIHLPAEKGIIKQACMWSNGPGVQPKTPIEAQSQFTQVLSALHIPSSLPWNEKLSRLRSIPAEDLLSAATSIPLHQFRPVTVPETPSSSSFSSSPYSFVSQTLFSSLANGTFARALSARNIRLLLGECRDEHTLYALWNPPASNTLSALRSRLCTDYPERVVDAFLAIYCPSGSNESLSSRASSSAAVNPETFGRIYADMQVHTTQRGLVSALASHGASHLLYRYRIEFRVRCVDSSFPREWGVTHATDQAIWFWGNGDVLTAQEKKIVKQAFIDPLAEFVKRKPRGPSGNGDPSRQNANLQRRNSDCGWGTTFHREMRTLKPDGSVAIWTDQLWEEKLRVWDALLRLSAGTSSCADVADGTTRIRAAKKSARL